MYGQEEKCVLGNVRERFRRSFGRKISK